MKIDADVVVIGAGVIGLAIARSLALKGREVLILEKEGKIGQGISSRNSEVIHAGIYYPKDSLKARLCVKGSKLLRQYCQDFGIPHQLLGKLIVATKESEITLLKDLEQKARANGVERLDWLQGSEAQAMEPRVRACAALWSPLTGIVDSFALMLSLLGEAENKGATLALNSPVLGGKLGEYLEVGGENPCQVKAKLLINAAGLGAQNIASKLQGLPDQAKPALYLCRGNYFGLTGKKPFSRLVYPVPVPGGLGVHYTLDMAGQARFGPDVEWIESENYQVDPKRGESFYAAIAEYWPGIKDGSLTPAYAGIRPKLDRHKTCDFLIQNYPDLGFIGLYGMESPGLTSALAIAEMIGEF